LILEVAPSGAAVQVLAVRRVGNALRVIRARGNLEATWAIDALLCGCEAGQAEGSGDDEVLDEHCILVEYVGRGRAD
jgi:hypothetical protein